MTTCSKCNTQVMDMAKFCQECGNQLSKITSDPVWIAGMQEKIKEARHNKIGFIIGGVFGVIVAVLAFSGFLLIPGYLNTLFWIIGAIGIEIIIGCFIGVWIYGRKVKEKTNQLSEGQKR
jgi:hypothetical protein